MEKDGTIKILGDKLLIKKLEKLRQLGVKQGQINAAFNRAGKPLRIAARSNAKQIRPRTKASQEARSKEKSSGTLWKSIKMIKSKRHRTLFWIGPARGRKQRFDGWYGKFLETGTKLRAGGRKSIKPYKYMLKAYAAKKNTVKYSMIREMNLLIKNQVK